MLDINDCASMRLMKLFITICIILRSTAEITTSNYEYSTKTTESVKEKPPARSCGGDLRADYLAQAIVAPAVELNERIYCEWWIKSPIPTLKIGLSVTETKLNYYFNEVKISVYDGPPSTSNLLKQYRGFHDLGDFLSATVSTSETIFINYTRTGPVGFGQFESKILYYLCGGLIQSNSLIRSPEFNISSPAASPDFLQCVWRFERSRSTQFGYFIIEYLHMPKVSRCEGLVLETYNGSLVTLENKNATAENSSDRNSTSYDRFDEERRYVCSKTAVGDSSLLSMTIIAENSTTSSNSSKENSTQSSGVRVKRLMIRGQNLLAVVFNGTTTTLKYTAVVPQTGNGFSIVYDIKRKRYKRKKRPDMPWYLDYAHVVFYVPIGLLLGSIIIAVQNRHNRKLPIRTFQLQGVSSTGPSVTEGPTQHTTPKAFVRSIMKRSKTTEVSVVSESSSSAGPGLQTQVDILPGDEKSPMLKTTLTSSRSGGRNKNKLCRKVTFKRTSIEEV